VPTSIAEALESVGLEREKVVRWGTRPSTPKSGVYLVALTSSLGRVDGTLPNAPLAAQIFERWLQVCPHLMLHGERPTIQELMDQISRFWLPDEAILYVGKATSLSSRCGAYYGTPIGARKPHSGGFFIKLLSDLDQLWVHYARCDVPQAAEDGMLARFCGKVSDSTKVVLADPTHSFPFANLEWPKGTCKSHGLTGVRA